MQILYLDASGDPGEYKQKNSKHFALVGIAVTPELSYSISREIRSIINLHFEGLNPDERPKELHYNHLIQTKYPYNKINARALADDVFQIILKSDVTLFAMIINKEQHYSKYVRPWPVREVALEAMINRFERFLRRKNDIGMMVYDSESPFINKTLTELFEGFKKDGTAFVYPEHILDTVFFAPSETAPMLQVADFCAYAFFSKYEHNKMERYDQIKSKLDEYGERLFPG